MITQSTMDMLQQSIVSELSFLDDNETSKKDRLHLEYRILIRLQGIDNCTLVVTDGKQSMKIQKTTDSCFYTSYIYFNNKKYDYHSNVDLQNFHGVLSETLEELENVSGFHLEVKQ